MKLSISRLAVLIFTAALLLGLLAGCGGGPLEGRPAGDQTQEDQTMEDQSDTPEEGEEETFRLTGFTAGTLEGGTFTEEDVQAKDVTVINFWSTTCGPCIDELPDLASIADALPENVQLVTVCLDAAGNEETARRLLEKAGFAGTTITSWDGDFTTLVYAVRYTPTTAFFDSQGALWDSAIIGGQKDLSAAVTDLVNQVLLSQGKEEIHLADA